MSEITEKIIAYEDGALNDEETIKLFQDLIDTGFINHLQGSYQRMANYLIAEGLVNAN